jgi:hypothetical protein
MSDWFLFFNRSRKKPFYSQVLGRWAKNNVFIAGKINYLPIYMTMFLKKRELPEDIVLNFPTGFSALSPAVRAV